MKYFIDFEATQFSNYIISIGCVRENGDEFYSLVKPVGKKAKITPFITNLTGITTETIADAPEADEVFKNFFDWCAEYDDIPEFYCYGNCDTNFCKTNFTQSENIKAKLILGFLHTGLKDFSISVQKHFGLVQAVGLAKVVQYYKGEEIVQSHNALDDAKMLKYVYEQIKSHTVEEDKTAFPDYKKKENKKPQPVEEKEYLVRISLDKKGKKVVKACKTMEDAVQFAYNKLPEGNQAEAKMENIQKRIIKASNTQTQYQHLYWKVK